ncbi:MAG: hypothetical protein KME31_29050 [Tolypothrix carrinoi HA7290-LM1]|jgi:hypothetical protein|nr:hypothetical protein [Tolypothrix carrinoi HA7290-LM1]
MPNDASCLKVGYLMSGFATTNRTPVRDGAAAVATTGGTPTPGASSRETLAAVAHGGNPQDRAALPTHWLRNALPWEPAHAAGSGTGNRAALTHRTKLALPNAQFSIPNCLRDC